MIQNWGDYGLCSDIQENHHYRAVLDKDTPLETTPHYTDKRFNQEQTVFGNKPEDGTYEHKHLDYSYSDRLWQFDYDKAQQAVEVANKGGAVPKSCRWYEDYLSAYFGKSVEIEHIIAGVNRSNGYPYCVFGYKFI